MVTHRESIDMKQYKLTVIGGTFDHLHKGHRTFLHFVLSQSKHVLLGLTSNFYTASKGLNSSMQPYNKRKEVLESFLKEEKALERIEILPIDNLFIPKQWEKLPIEAIIVSEDSEKGALLINDQRKKKSMLPLAVIVHPLVRGEDRKVISSFRIRNGEINREGKPYLHSEWLNKSLVLPHGLRKKLQEPFGELVRDFDQWFSLQRHVLDSKKIVTVGDAVTMAFNKNHSNQLVSVIDYRIKRVKKFTTPKELGFSEDIEVRNVDNPPGYITASLFQEVVKLFMSHDSRKQHLICVHGEEDLAVLPFVLVAPLGFIIFYGQPEEGVVKVDVTEEIKEEAYRIILDFILQ